MGAYQIIATLNDPDNKLTNYLITNTSGTLTISAAVPTVTWAAPSAIVYRTALSSAQLNATADVSGIFLYSPAAGTVPTAGTQTLSVVFTLSDSVNCTKSTATVPLIVNKATPIITWPTPAAIVYGTVLNATQQNAISSVPGAFVYSPAAGTIPLIGTVSLSATFTPSDSTDYIATSSTVMLAIVPPIPTINSLSPAVVTAGGSGFTLTVTGSGFTAASKILLGSTALATTSINGTQLSAEVPASAIATAGAFALTVQTPAPSGGTSSTLHLEVDSAGSSGPLPSQV